MRVCKRLMFVNLFEVYKQPKRIYANCPKFHANSTQTGMVVCSTSKNKSIEESNCCNMLFYIASPRSTVWVKYDKAFWNLSPLPFGINASLLVMFSYSPEQTRIRIGPTKSMHILSTNSCEAVQIKKIGCVVCKNSYIHRSFLFSSHLYYYHHVLANAECVCG